MARRRRAPRPPSRRWAIVTLIVAGAAGGLLYNVLAPRGIFKPEAAMLTPPSVRVNPPAERPRVKPPPPVVVPNPVPDVPLVAPPVQPVLDKPYAPLVISLDQAATIFQEGRAIWVDARSPEVYAFGHVPAALNLPHTDPEAGYARLAARLPRSGRIVVYCTSADCDEAGKVLAMLVTHGYRNLSHFKEGWNIWEITDLPQEKGPGKP